MPKLFADEVIQAILDICNPAETEETWNGALIALGDIIRQRLVELQRLPEILTVLVSAFLNRYK